MTQEQHKFFAMLDNYQRLRKFWNYKSLSLDIEELKQELNQLSSGERHMAKFFASVWLNDSEQFHFDFISAVRVLDDFSIQLIKHWLDEPNFP